MMDKIFSFIEKKLVDAPWSNVYGLARSVLALGTLITLVANHTTILFHPLAGVPAPPVCGGWLQNASAYCAFGSANLELVRFLSIAGLLLVCSGWRPRFTGLLHFYIVYSFYSSVSLSDGGDQVAMVLTTLLVPLTLTDSRKWHWAKPKAYESSVGEMTKRIIGVTTFFVLQVQVALLYFNAAITKFSVEEWIDGTILYYWWQDPIMGVADWFRPIADFLVETPTLVVALTWGSLALEMILFCGLFMSKKSRQYLLYPGMLFHLMIALTMGLWSFACSMIAALILFTRPFENEFKWLHKVKIPINLNFARAFFKRRNLEGAVQNTI